MYLGFFYMNFPYLRSGGGSIFELMSGIVSDFSRLSEVVYKRHRFKGHKSQDNQLNVSHFASHS